MMGIEFIKLDPIIYVLHYKNGVVKREGAGLSFFYFAPTSTIAAVPMNTIDVPFAFNEVTADFQTVTIQGQLSYRVTDPKKLAGLLNFAVNNGGKYLSDDPAKMVERLVHTAQSLVRGIIQGQELRKVLAGAETIAAGAFEKIKKSDLIAIHGIEVLGFSIVSLRPTPETSKALEAEAREALLRKADEAVYSRRNAAVEQERTIQESELDTEKALEDKKKQVRQAQMDAEIAVEEKKRQVREVQMGAEISVEEKKRQVREVQMGAEIAIEEKRSSLMEKRVKNDRLETDSRAYALERMLTPIKEVDWRILSALGGGGMDSKFMIAAAFEKLAENAQKIGELSITPDLLNTLLSSNKK